MKQKQYPRYFISLKPEPQLLYRCVKRANGPVYCKWEKQIVGDYRHLKTETTSAYLEVHLENYTGLFREVRPEELVLII